jgi:hypothetical protein
MLPPFINATGLISKILTKITEAQQPERFTLDFLKTKLGYGSGSARPIIPFLKRIGMLASEGTPTSLYSRFRNPSERGRAMAEAMRIGYKGIFERNEYAQELPKEKLKNLVVEMTGLEPKDGSVTAVVSSFLALRAFADFDALTKSNEVEDDAHRHIERFQQDLPPRQPPTVSNEQEEAGFNLSYTINLNLPETTDVEVFNAIFRSLRANLLRR